MGEDDYWDALTYLFRQRPRIFVGVDWGVNRPYPKSPTPIRVDEKTTVLPDDWKTYAEATAKKVEGRRVRDGESQQAGSDEGARLGVRDDAHEGGTEGRDGGPEQVRSLVRVRRVPDATPRKGDA